MSVGAIVGLAVGIPAALIVGLIIGFVVAQKYFKKQITDNPPINKDAIRELYRSVGRTPSEAQINQTMEAMKRHTSKK